MVEWSGGGIPYGYKYNEETKKLIVNDEENRILQGIFEMAYRGSGSMAIADNLNQNGLISRFGEKWTLQTVSYLLSPSRIKFYLGYSKEGEQGNWQPLIFKDMAKVLIERKGEPTKSTYKKKDTYLLSNLDVLLCGYCNSKMKASVTVKKKEKVLYYLCSLRQTSGKSQCQHSRLQPQEPINKLILYDLNLCSTLPLSKIFIEYKVFKTKKIQDLIIDSANSIIKNTQGSIDVPKIKEALDDIDNSLKELKDIKPGSITIPGESIESQRLSISEAIESIKVWHDKLEIKYKFPIDYEFHFTKTKELIHGKKQISPD